MKLSSLEKRIKRRIVGPEQPFFAVCSPGLEALCKAQMLKAGIPKDNLQMIHGGIEFTARLATAIELNLSLGIPARIIMRISQFKADSFEKLEKKINEIDWILYLPKDCPIQFKVTAKKSRLYHSDAIAQRCEGIILKHLGQNRKPKNLKAAQTIYIRADHDQFTISLDTSGDILFKRGIKKKVSHAPLRENLAFAMLTWAGFSTKDILVDPMCGSGTFAIEAAMIKSNMPPGFFRSFAFESWPAFSPNAFAHLKKKAHETMVSFPEKQIFASDTDEDAVAILRENIEGHAFCQMIDAVQKDFFDILAPELLPDQKGVIMLNPPYGKRLGNRYAAPSFFHDISKKLKSDFKGWHVGIVLPDKECVTALGLPLDFKPISHGGLEIFAGIGQV